MGRALHPSQTRHARGPLNLRKLAEGSPTIERISTALCEEAAGEEAPSSVERVNQPVVDRRWTAETLNRSVRRGLP